jgi:hypothetical protein
MFLEPGAGSRRHLLNISRAQTCVVWIRECPTNQGGVTTRRALGLSKPGPRHLWPLAGPPRRHHLGDATGHEPHRQHEERSEHREH